MPKKTAYPNRYERNKETTPSHQGLQNLRPPVQLAQEMEKGLGGGAILQ